MATPVKYKRYNGTEWEELYFPYSHTHKWSEVTETPTTLSGYGITDVFKGTYAEYEAAYAAGLIPVGALVFITDDGVNDDAASSLLGTGQLGYMILG